MTAYYNEGPSAGVPLLRRSLTAFGYGRAADGGQVDGDELRWLWLSVVAGAMRIWDHELMDVLSARHVRLARWHRGAERASAGADVAGLSSTCSRASSAPPRP